LNKKTSFTKKLVQLPIPISHISKTENLVLQREPISIPVPEPVPKIRPNSVPDFIYYPEQTNDF
jgi:hypothetical protein